MTRHPDLDAAYALQTPDDNRRLYADWAQTYDADFADAHGYVLHQQVADAFARAKGQGPVLDIGAGTGLCGAALMGHGIGPRHGTDISPEMLEIAAAKNVYERLFPGDILTGLAVPDGSYAGIVSSGTFTNGHVGPDALDEVLRLLAPGGLAILSINEHHYVAAGFASKIDSLRPALSDLALPLVRIYAPGSDGPHGEDRAILAEMRKPA